MHVASKAHLLIYSVKYLTSMRTQTKKYAIIVCKATLLSFGLYAMVLVKAVDKLVENEVAQFHLFTKSITDYKSTLYLLGVLFEAEIKATHTSEQYGPYLKSGKIYAADNKSGFTINERIVSMTANRLLLNMPEVTMAEEVLFYYRSYESDKIMATQSFELANGIRPVSLEKMCNESMTCTKYSNEDDLKNRLIISNIYRDNVTDQPIMTISSPVYFEKEILGDINVDVYLRKFPFLENKEFIDSEAEHGRQIVLEDMRYPFIDHAYSIDYLADDNFVITYRIPYSKIVTDYGWLFIGLIILLTYVMNRLDELKVKREKLKIAEVAIRKDELTGLYNRTILKDSAIKYAMEKQGIAVIAIDGDKVKAVNDNYGHHVGDEAIIHIANSMRRCFRESDYLIRSGGDEFIAILPGCTLLAAEKVAKKFADEVTSKPFGAESLTLEVSFGCTVLREHESLDSVLKRADASLYLAKEHKYE